MGAGAEDRVTGIAAALADVAMGPLSAPADAGGQPDLWDDGEGVGAGPLDDPLKALGSDLFQKPRRGGGRPAGAKNRSTEAWRAFFLSRRRDPALVLGDLYSMPVEELAMRLSCDRLDAIKVQMRAAEILMPYVHQKQPLAIKNADGNLPTLHLHMPYVPAAAAGPVDDAGVIDLFAQHIEQNQGLSALSGDPVGTAPLAGTEKAQRDQGLVPDWRQIAHQAGDMSCDMIVRDTSHDGGVARDMGGAPPHDDPPVFPLPVSRDDKV